MPDASEGTELQHLTQVHEALGSGLRATCVRSEQLGKVRSGRGALGKGGHCSERRVGSQFLVTTGVRVEAAFPALVRLEPLAQLLNTPTERLVLLLVHRLAAL